MMTNTKQPSLPPAPDGFAWMPMVRGLPPPIKGETWYTYGDTCICPMRRLGPTEKPWGECRGLDFGEWYPTNEHPKSMSLEWYAPVRSPPGQAPDFGRAGWRYLDEGEEPGLWVWDGVRIDGQRVKVVPFSLPPLPESDELLLTEAEAFEQSRVIYAEILADASDAPKLRAEVEALRARLAEVTAEPDDRCLSWCGGVGVLHRFDSGQCSSCGCSESLNRNGTPYEAEVAILRSRAEEADLRQARAEDECETLRAQLAHYRDIAQRAAVDSTDPVRWLEVLEEIAEGVW